MALAVCRLAMPTGTGKFRLWAAGDYDQINPQLTDMSGTYSFLVPPGTYKLKVWHEKLQETSKEVAVQEGKTVSVEFEKDKLKQR